MWGHDPLVWEAKDKRCTGQVVGCGGDGLERRRPNGGRVGQGDQFAPAADEVERRGAVGQLL